MPFFLNKEQNMYSQNIPNRGDNVFLVQQASKPSVNSTAWEIHETAVEQVFYAPSKPAIDGAAECSPVFALSGTWEGYLFKEDEVYFTLEEAQFEVEAREIFL